LCASLQTQLSAAEEDIKDFTESSKELQNELEQELERMEKAEKGMRRELEMVQGDREEWKVSQDCATLRSVCCCSAVAVSANNEGNIADFTHLSQNRQSTLQPYETTRRQLLICNEN